MKRNKSGNEYSKQEIKLTKKEESEYTHELVKLGRVEAVVGYTKQEV